MCIARVKRGDAPALSDEVLKNCFENNPDGAGWAGVNTDHLGRRKLTTYHSMEFENWLKKLRRFEKNNPDENMLIHTRIGTSGEESTFNCHPFNVNKKLCFIHNGMIISVKKDPYGRKNDTQIFNEDILQGLPENWMEYDAILDMIEDYIGYSKLAFLDEDGKYLILNEHKGVWKDGVWYSNDSYKKPKWKYIAPKKGKNKNKNIPQKTLPPPRRINYASTVACDCCGNNLTIWALQAYDLYSYVEGYCEDCERGHLLAGTIYEHEKTTKNHYLDYVNNGSVYGDDGFPDYSGREG